MKINTDTFHNGFRAAFAKTARDQNSFFPTGHILPHSLVKYFTLWLYHSTTFAPCPIVCLLSLTVILSVVAFHIVFVLL